MSSENETIEIDVGLAGEAAAEIESLFSDPQARFAYDEERLTRFVEEVNRKA